jgi:transcriptional regulator with PAS, ATPase and Fis domain
MLEIYKKIAMIADLRSTVLITGESGTGKELVAKAIHYNSRRSKEPFVAVNCGALTESLLESELFGHVRGSFTGAFENKRGILEEASGGVVFLDEVSEMSQALQVKLLRAIEALEVRRVGGSQAIHIDVRFIAATNRPLDELVRQKAFREDLYYRLKVVEIDLPPLRDRSEDIPLLIEHFLKRLSDERGQAHAVSPEALGALVSYSWPGNVRELENALESAVAVNRTGVLTPEDLPPKLLRDLLGDSQRADDLYADLPSLEELKKRYVTYVLRLSDANKAKASDILGVSRRTLYNILEKYKLPC